MPGKRRSACTCGSFFYLGIASSLRALGYRTNTWSHKHPSRYCAKCFMRTGILRFLRNTSFRYTKPWLCVHWRSKSLSLQPGTDPFTTQSFDFLSFWIRETNCSVHGTDPFATQNANFLNLYFRNRLTGSTEPIDLLHKASTSSVSVSENRFIRFTEPIRLLHRTQNS